MSNNVWHYKTTGRFNLCSNEQQDQVVLRTPVGNVSETWDLDESGYDEDMLPSEVSALIRERVKSYWISTSRERNLATLDAIDAVANELDIAFMRKRAADKQAQAARLWKEARGLLDDAEDKEAAHV